MSGGKSTRLKSSIPLSALYETAAFIYTKSLFHGGKMQVLHGKTNSISMSPDSWHQQNNALKRA